MVRGAAWRLQLIRVTIIQSRFGIGDLTQVLSGTPDTYKKADFNSLQMVTKLLQSSDLDMVRAAPD